MIKIATAKYLSPTNTKGSRLKITMHDGEIVIRPWDYSGSCYADAQCNAIIRSLGFTPLQSKDYKGDMILVYE